MKQTKMKKALLVFSKLHFDPTKETKDSQSSAGIIARSFYNSLIKSGFDIEYKDHSEIDSIKGDYDLFLSPPFRWMDIYNKINSKTNILFLGTTHPLNRNKKMVVGRTNWKIPFLEDILTNDTYNIKSFHKADYIIQIGNQETINILLDNNIDSGKIIHMHYGLDYELNELPEKPKDFLDNYLYLAACFGLRKGFFEIVKIFTSPTYLKKKITLVGSLCKTDNLSFWEKKLNELKQRNSNTKFEDFITSGTRKYNDVVANNAWYVFPTLEEGEPGTVLEAMTAGVVPVLSKESNIDFEINDEFDIPFSKRLEKTLLIKEAEWKTLSKKSKHYIEIFHSHYHWEQRLIEIFNMFKEGNKDLQPTASIILTIHNKEKSIAELLNLLWRNTKTYTKWDLHIIYDGCSDNTKEVANKVLKTFSVPIFEYETPDVFEVKANNLGLKKATGKYCLVIQDDNYIYEERWLEKMLSWMELNPKVGVLGGLAGVNFFQLDKEITGKGVNKTLFENHQRLDKLNDSKLNNLIYEVDAVMRGPIVFRKELLDLHGYLDEIYCPLYNDDMDYCFRMKKLGYGVFCYPIDVVNKSLTIAKYNSPEKKKFWLEALQKNQKIFYNRWVDEIGKNHETQLRVPKPQYKNEKNKFIKRFKNNIKNINMAQKIYEVKKSSKQFLYKLFLKTPELVIKVTIKIASIIGGKFTGLSKKIHLHFYQRRIIQWIVNKGDTTLRLNYHLDDRSIVFDVGGYKGDWARDIFCLYGCNVYIFEPVNEFIDKIKSRFGKNKKIRIFAFGLSDRSKKIKFSSENNASSEFTNKGNTIDVEMRDVAELIKNENIQKIDLMKINIEGGEYPLLERIINTGLINRVENIQIQFHDFVPDAEKRMKRIQDELKKTHSLTYQEKFVWENWKKNDTKY